MQVSNQTSSPQTRSACNSKKGRFLSADERVTVTTGTKSEEDLIESDPTFQEESTPLDVTSLCYDSIHTQKFTALLLMDFQKAFDTV